MEKRILFIGGEKEWFKESPGPNTKVEISGFGKGLQHLEYKFYEHLAVHNMIPIALGAEKDGIDAIVIGCFYDPGLKEIRELVNIPIIGVGEATLHFASMLSAGKFSVLVGQKKWISKMAENARNYGCEHKIASWRVMGLSVTDMCDKQKTQEAILREAKVAIEEDMAEVICLGCTGMAGQALYVQKTVGVPVLDPVLIGLKMAELQADVWKRFSISHSKIGGYGAPSADEFMSTFKKFYDADIDGKKPIRKLFAKMRR